MQNGDLDVTIIAKNDHAGRVIIANKTGVPVNIKLPEAFAAVPVAAQFGGGGGGQGGGGFGGGGGQGGGQQSGGGGFGGGGQGGGGGGGMFSIPPDETAKIPVALVCLDHGLKDPSSSKPYKLVPAESHIDKPAVIELLKAFGRGELNHGAAQAAAWNLNSDMSWDALAAKQTGTVRNINRSPYFSTEQIRAGMAYAQEATRRAEVAAEAKAAEEADARRRPSRRRTRIRAKNAARSTTRPSSRRPRLSANLRRFELHRPQRGEQPADLRLVFDLLEMPARFHLLVVLLLPIEFLLAGHEPRRLVLDVLVPPLGPLLQLVPLRLERVELIRQIASHRFELRRLRGDAFERLPIVIGELRPHDRNRPRQRRRRHRAGKLVPSLFGRQPHLERLALRVPQLAAQLLDRRLAIVELGLALVELRVALLLVFAELLLLRGDAPAAGAPSFPGTAAAGDRARGPAR